MICAFSISDKFLMTTEFQKNDANAANQTVKMLTISDDEAGQRIDNYLLGKLKGVPKSLIYRILRKGEVRVNKGRIKPEYKLRQGDVVRVPPVRVSEKEQPQISNKLSKVAQLEQQIIFEDDCLLVLNKPSGTAVHGGSGLSFGVIEALRALRPEARFFRIGASFGSRYFGAPVGCKKTFRFTQLTRTTACQNRTERLFGTGTRTMAIAL